MSELKVCANKKCKESSRDSTLQFFPFPKNLKTYRQWLERSGRKDLLKKPSQILGKTYFLCEKHFNKFDMMKNGKKRLPYDAMPLEFGKIFKQFLPRFRNSTGNSSEKSTKTVKTLKKTLNTLSKLPGNSVETAVNSKSDKKPSLGVSHTAQSLVEVNKKPKKLFRSSSAIPKLSIKKTSKLNRDGKEFNVHVFKDVDPDEIAEYKKLYPKLENIADRPVHCTSCNCHIGTAPINEAIIKMHPVLRVIQCKKCYTFYTSGEFERGEDGSEFYCRWCGQGGEVYCCSKCPKVFCRRCIEQNLSKGKVDEIQNNENWICFSCDPVCMTQLKADYWALLNFIEKQKKEITNKSLTEKELNEAMSKDCTTCCTVVKKRMYGKRKSSNSIDAIPPPPKRIDTGTTSSEPPTIINDALAKRVQNKKPGADEGIKVQCSPDLGSMPSDNKTPKINTPPSHMRLVRQLKVVPITSTPHSVQSASQTNQQNLLLDVHTAPPTKNPVFHTINGFRVDLNTAAQHETYRLPNGKLIQVRKQQPAVVANASKPPTNASTVSSTTLNTPTTSTSMVNSSKVIPPTLTTSKSPTALTPVLPLLRVPPPLVIPTQPQPARPGTVLIRHGSRGRGRGRGRPSLPFTQIRPPSLQQRQMIQIHRNVSEPNQLAENEIHITSLSQTTRKRKKPGNPTKTPINSPVEQAKSQFEIRVDNSMEVCEHIIGKMKTLTSSTAFKSVKTLTDVKDLTIHLSYLLTYAVGRFKTLQEKCGGDMKDMGFDPDSPKSDDDDIEILEPNTTLIELDSDENDSERETRKAVEILLNVEDTETDVPVTVKNATESVTPIIQQNGTENETEAIDSNDEQLAISNTKSVTANGYDIVEINESVNDDKNETENFITDGKKTEEIDKSESGLSNKRDTAQNSEQKTEEHKLKNQSVEIDTNSTKISEKTNNENEKKITAPSTEISVESSVPQIDTVVETMKKDEPTSVTDAVIEKIENVCKPKDENDKRVIVNETKSVKPEMPKELQTNDKISSPAEEDKSAANRLTKGQTAESSGDGTIITKRDTETEQLQKLLEESDEIESPSMENLSGDVDEQPAPKQRTNSEITINVSNVESIDEDIFENLIEEVNEVGENTNDDSSTSEINETSENSVNGDDNMLEDNPDKDFDKSKDPENSLDADDLSESDDIVHDENDLDLSLSSEIVLDPESDKVDEEMEGVNDEDERTDNVGGIDYFEEETVENYEIVSESSDCIMDSAAKESVDIDSSI